MDLVASWRIPHRHRTGWRSLIDWTEVAGTLGGVYSAAKGESAWPPLALFKALLLAAWYDLSDVNLAEALADRASFRRLPVRSQPDDGAVSTARKLT